MLLIPSYRLLARSDDDGAGHFVVASAAEHAAAHGIDAGSLGEEADDGGVFGLDGLVDAEAWDGDAVLDIGGGDDQLDACALGDFEASGLDVPFFHDDLTHRVGRTGKCRSLPAAAGHRKKEPQGQDEGRRCF